MSLTLDANILIYAVNADEPRHERAREALADIAAGPETAYVFWPVVMAFLRISTRPGLFPHPLSPSEALSTIGALLQRPHVLSPGEDERFWEVFHEIAAEQPVRGDLVTDAHIVALMRRHGVRTIVTHDREFRRFDGIRVRDPFS